MNVLGISPLDKDATASLVVDGKVVFAAAEERFSRKKFHSGFPYASVQAALKWAGLEPKDLHAVAYAFYDAPGEARLMGQSVARSRRHGGNTGWRAALAQARPPATRPVAAVPGLRSLEQTMEKGNLKRRAYQVLGTAPLVSREVNRRLGDEWLRQAVQDHEHWQSELARGLRELGITAPLRRYEHHETHAANAYYPSGFDRALILSIDGYGSGLAGAVSLGEGGKITRLQGLAFPYSLGMFYEQVTSALGFRPDRHAGKIVGLAAYGDTQVLGPALRARFRVGDGSYSMVESFNRFFSYYLASAYPMIDVAAAYQWVLEQVAAETLSHWVQRTGCSSVVLSGGVTANVKMNQRLFEVPGVERIFVYPNMGDGGCGTGAALLASGEAAANGTVDNVYYGPSYGEREIEQALDAAGLTYRRPEAYAEEVGGLLDAGRVVAYFDGRMEYGPRALGARSILCSARDPHINVTLNERMLRTEFMPFAPVTLWEERQACFKNVEGAEQTAQFMTVTFDCTPMMRETAPAAVHIDGTARPQLIRREVNARYYDIVDAYRRRTGTPTIINTSFNMHEEPIVCSPGDAVRSFLQGNLDALAIGPFLVERDAGAG